MSRACRACGAPFRPDGSWQKLCWSCWREAKANESPLPPKTVQVPVETVSQDVLRQAIRLTHPDAHPIERFEQANAVTAALLDALDRLKGAA